MKQIFAFFFLLLLVFKIGGYVGLMLLEQEKLREEVEERVKKNIPSADLTCIANSASIEWERVGKEFRYEGQLYDVVRVEKKREVVYYYCLSDEKETQLLNKIQSFGTNNSTSAMNTTTKSILVLLFQQFISPNSSTIFKQSIESSFNNLYPLISLLYSSAFAKELLHPPIF